MHHWLKRAILALTLLALVCSANAEGRWGARIEYPLHANAYVETVAYNVGSWELGTGIMGRLSQSEPLELTPYVVLSNYREDYWYSIEAALPVAIPTAAIGFQVAVSIGGRFGPTE